MTNSAGENKMQTTDEQINELTARIKWLESFLKSFDVPGNLAWKLSPQQSRLLYIIAAREIVLHEAILPALYWDRDEPQDAAGVIRTVLHELRRKLRPFGIEIHTKNAVGLFLDAETRQRVLGEKMGTSK